MFSLLTLNKVPSVVLIKAKMRFYSLRNGTKTFRWLFSANKAAGSSDQINKFTCTRNILFILS